MQDLKLSETEELNMHCQDDVAPRQLLHEAVDKRDINEVKRLIKSGIDVNAASKNGMTALHLTSLVENPEVVEILELLLKAGGEVNAKAEDGTTPLHLAVLTKNEDGIKVLLDYNADVNCQENISHFTPLHLAAYVGCFKIIELLIWHGVQINQTAKDDITPLHLASIKGDLKTVKILVDYGASVSCLTKSGQYTMLHLALMDRQEDVNKIINVDDNRSECSSYLKSIEVIDFAKRKNLYYYLVTSGININTKDIYGKAAIHFAASNGFNRAVKWILLLDANLHLKDNEGYLAFHCALINDNVRGLWDLTRFGADVNDVRAIKSSIPRIMSEKLVAMGLTRHLIKLKAANLFIANIYKPYVNMNGYHVFYRHCLLEVAKMRSFYITENITLYDWLHLIPKKRQALIGNRRRAWKDYKFVAPMYTGIIEASFQEIVNWNALVNSAVPAFYTIFEFDFPEVCVANIFSFLDSYTLRVIIETIT